MTTQEIVILNSLVTYAAENIPGGLNEQEQAVALIVGQWATQRVPVAPVCPHCGDVRPLRRCASHVDQHPSRERPTPLVVARPE
jgi:hypothetical protein